MNACKSPIVKTPRGFTVVRAPRGFTVVEMIISCALSAIILMAIATALSASTSCFKSNQERASLGNRSRLAMNTLVLRMRMTQNSQPHTAAKVIDFQVNKHEFATDGSDMGVQDTAVEINNVQRSLDASPTTADTTAFVYRWVDNDDNGKPVHELRLLAGGAEYVVLDGVTDFRVNFYPTRSDDAKTKGLTTCDAVESATISMTVESTHRSMQTIEMGATAKYSVTLSTSITPLGSSWTGTRTPYTIADLRN